MSSTVEIFCAFGQSGDRFPVYLQRKYLSPLNAQMRGGEVDCCLNFKDRWRCIGYFASFILWSLKLNVLFLHL
jgi:hypothetical protein